MNHNGFKPLTAADIAELDDVVIEPHPVPQWGENRGVYVRSVSALERGEIEANAARFKESHGKNDGFAKTFTVTMAWLGMCDAEGRRLFTDRADVAMLQKRNAAAIAGIAEHVQRLSGFSKEDLEELEKNSQGPQRSDSDTD
jgi:hypothetical protein